MSSGGTRVRRWHRIRHETGRTGVQAGVQPGRVHSQAQNSRKAGKVPIQGRSKDALRQNSSLFGKTRHFSANSSKLGQNSVTPDRTRPHRTELGHTGQNSASQVRSGQSGQERPVRNGQAGQERRKQQQTAEAAETAGSTETAEKSRKEQESQKRPSDRLSQALPLRGRKRRKKTLLDTFDVAFEAFLPAQRHLSLPFLFSEKCFLFP